MLVHGAEVDFRITLEITDNLFDVLLAKLCVDWLFPRERAQHLTQSIPVCDRTVVCLQLESQTDIQVQIGLFARGQACLILIFAKLAQSPLTQDKVFLVEGIPLQLRRNVQGTRFGIAFKVIDFIGHMAFFCVLLQQR